MTKLIQMTLALLALFCAVMTTPANAAPFTKPGTGKSASLSQAYTWYDGNSAQQVWLNPDLLAEFKPSAGGLTLLLRSSYYDKTYPDDTRDAGVVLRRYDHTCQRCTFHKTGHRKTRFPVAGLYLV